MTQQPWGVMCLNSGFVRDPKANVDLLACIKMKCTVNVCGKALNEDRLPSSELNHQCLPERPPLLWCSWASEPVSKYFIIRCRCRWAAAFIFSDCSRDYMRILVAEWRHSVLADFCSKHGFSSKAEHTSCRQVCTNCHTFLITASGQHQHTVYQLYLLHGTTLISVLIANWCQCFILFFKNTGKKYND